MINNADYLIQKYAEAREKMNESGGEQFYWKGVMDTYHSLLILGFHGWADKGTVGYYVFYENMSYDAALAKAAPFRKAYQEEDPEERYWKNAATYNERHSHDDYEDDYDY
jgi:hypothetical protein